VRCATTGFARYARSCNDSPSRGLFAAAPHTKIRRMNLKAALLATAAAGAFLLVAACGGGVSDSASSGSNSSSGTTGSSSGSNGTSAQLPNPGPSVPPLARSTTSRGCQPLNQTTTIIGGDLFVADQGPVRLTLLSDGGLGSSPIGMRWPDGSFNQYGFALIYDNVFGISNVSNRQDKWGSASPSPFPPGTPAGTSTEVQFRPPDPTYGYAVPITFPKGIPVELELRIYDGYSPRESNFSKTASICKDYSISLPSPQASVTYGTNNTATVTFFATNGGGFSVGLTNVCGSGLPSSSYTCSTGGPAYFTSADK
jgi:hypothetical protein